MPCSVHSPEAMSWVFDRMILSTRAIADEKGSTGGYGRRTACRTAPANRPATPLLRTMHEPNAAQTSMPQSGSRLSIAMTAFSSGRPAATERSTLLVR